MTTIDWIVVGGYVVVLMAIGFVQKKRAEGSAADYFVSGRKLPWWIAGTSMIAASFASDTPLLVAGYVHGEGLSGNWVWWGFGISTLLSTFLFSRLWRRSRVLTEVELAELRYSGAGASILRGTKAVYWGVLYNCFAVGALGMLGLSKVLQATVEWSPIQAILICGAVAAVYTVLSGFWGVVATDLFQFVLAVFGSLACAWCSVEAAGGWARVLELAPAAKTQLIPPSDSPAFTAFLAFVLVQWWAWKNTDGGGLLVQRMAACRDERHAVLAMLWYNVVHVALRSWPWVVVALSAYAVLPDLRDPEMSYPAMMMKVLPTGLKGLLIGWFLAEFMSVVSTNSNWGASLLVNDLYRRFWKKEKTEAHYVAMGRLATLAILAGATVCGFFATNVRSSFEIILGGTAALGVVLLLRWLWWRVNAWTEIVVMVTSPLASFWAVPWLRDHGCFSSLGLPSNRLTALLASVALGLVPALVVTLLTPAVSMERLQSFFRRVRPPRWGWGPVARHCPETISDLSFGRVAVPWLLGIAGVYGLMYSVYAFLFGRPLAFPALIGSLLSLAGVLAMTPKSATEEAPVSP